MPAKNYSNRKKHNDSQGSNGLTGVILIVISAFFLVCVAFSSFSAVCLFIRNVITGLIGYTAYPFFVCMLIFGVMLLQNKKSVLSKKNSVLVLATAVCLILLLQLITAKGYASDGYLAYVDGVFKNNTVGGVIFGTIVYGIQATITVPATYVFLIVLMAIFLFLLFMDFFGSKNKRTKRVKSGKMALETQKPRDFVKGLGASNLMQTIPNSGLFVEKVRSQEDESKGYGIISQAGKFEEIKESKKAELSKYGSGIEFEKYDKVGGSDAKSRKKAEAHKSLFGENKHERITPKVSTDSLFTPRFASSDANYDAQRDLYNKITSNYIPGMCNEPKVEKIVKPKEYKSDDDVNNIAKKYGLREIALPPAKDISDKFIQGPIINGDAFSESLRATSRPVDSYSDQSNQSYNKLLEPNYSVSNDLRSGIINGDYYTSKKEEQDNQSSSNYNNQYGSYYQPTYGNQPNYSNQFNNQPNYNGQPNYNNQPNYAGGQNSFNQSGNNNQPNYGGQPNYSNQPTYNGQPNYSNQPTYGGQPNYNDQQNYSGTNGNQLNNNQVNYNNQQNSNGQSNSNLNNHSGNFGNDRYTGGGEQSNGSFKKESSFEELVKADKAINRDVEDREFFQNKGDINNNYPAFEKSQNTEQNNFTVKTVEDDYYQPFERETDVKSEEDERLNENFKFTAPEEADYKDNTNLIDYRQGVNNAGDDAESSYGKFNSANTQNSSKQVSDETGDNQDSANNYYIKEEHGAGVKDQPVADNRNPAVINNQTGSFNLIQENSGFKILDGVIDKSETGYEENRRTGYYVKEGEEFEEAGHEEEFVDENIINLDKSFRKTVDEIENNVFNKSSKLKPENQINIDDYLKNTSPAVEKPAKRKKNYRYVPPPLDLLLDSSTDPSLYGGDCEKKAVILEETLKSLKFPSKVIGITKGPAVTRYEMETTPGIPIKRVESCAKDIAYALESNGKIRIETPIPGRRAVGVEVPNEQIATVSLRDIIKSKEFIGAPSSLTLAIGKDITGNIITSNLEKMPHLLIAGATGTGKSVCLNSIITSILYKASPEDVRLILIDPKRVEFVVFKDMPHLLMKNIITEPLQAINAFKWAKNEMERRYMLFSRYVNKNIQEFNNNSAVKSGSENKMPYIVIIVDELSDLMMSNNNCRKELEDKIMSMAQKARAAGIHLILATQRPSVDVITGTIKANLPSRIAFAVTSIHDSKTVLDQIGAEALLGKGDMLYSPIDWSDPRRVQGAYITSEEVEAVVEYVKENNYFEFDEEAESSIMHVEEESDSEETASEECTFDPLMKDALRRVIETGQASTSMIQRRFSVGYARAARIMDQMELNKFVGASEGAKPREVYITREQFREVFGEDV